MVTIHQHPPRRNRPSVRWLPIRTSKTAWRRVFSPSIFGSQYIKKAIVCVLFGGSRERMPDGLTRRGDIIILLLGDPVTAESQLLKFVERVSPIAVYTSGNGSSAAGLIASVFRDPATRNFIMEGGGRWGSDQFLLWPLGRYKGEENIDFMPTILSRFDIIFIVKDVHDQARDITLAKHIINVHMNANKATLETQKGEVPLVVFKKYINYCRTHCGPRLNDEAAKSSNPGTS